MRLKVCSWESCKAIWVSWFCGDWAFSLRKPALIKHSQSPGTICTLFIIAARLWSPSPTPPRQYKKKREREREQLPPSSPFRWSHQGDSAVDNEWAGLTIETLFFLIIWLTQSKGEGGNGRGEECLSSTVIRSLYRWPCPTNWKMHGPNAGRSLQRHMEQLPRLQGTLTEETSP